MNRLALSSYRTICLALALGLIGFLLNHFLPVALYYKLSFLSGSIVALLALELIGARAGILIGVAAAAATLLLWGQPFPFVVLSAEILVIMLLRRHISSNLMVSTSLYWMFVGGPLVWGLYHFVMETELVASTVYALKFCVNGIFNALLASLILMAIRFFRFRHTADPVLRIPFSEALALLLTAVVFIPTLIATVISLRVELLDQERQLRKTSLQVTESSQQVLLGWFQDWAKTLDALGHISEQITTMPRLEQQQHLQLLMATDPSIVRIGLLDRAGRIIAHQPAQDNQGQSMIGRDFSKHPPIAQAIKAQKPVISKAYRLGYMGSIPNVVLMTQPLMHNNKLDGFTTALIDLRKFNTRLQFVAQRRGIHITVIDQLGEITASSTPRPTLTAKPGLTTQHPPKTPGVPWLDVMRQAHLVSRVPFGGGIPWEMIVETPYAPIVRELNLRAVGLLGLLFGLMTTVVLVAQVAGRRFSRTIHDLEQATSSLPLQISRGEAPVWPNSILKEVGELTSNAQEMAASLSDAFQELKTINDNLEQRVEERTVELRETAKKLEDSRNEAEAASAAKGRFLAMMSHEIRTPMNAIMGITGLLQKTDLNSQQRELLNHADDSASSLLQIINDILDFSRIEADKLEIIPEPFSLRALLDTLQSLFATIAQRQHLTLELKVPESVPDLLIGDSGRLRQVLSNLVGNALKFTPAGSITIAVEQLPATAELRLLFSVEDTGIGIDAGQHTAIFHMFRQVDDSTTRRFGGTGLGLAICQQLVGLMGGSIAVRSEPGKGSCFSFDLPFGVATELTESAFVQQADQQLQRLRILLAEDHPVNQLVAREMLISLGQEVVTVENGRQLLQMLTQQPFDLVLTDISMPEMDGLQAVAAIRAGEVPGIDPQIPVIAMTAHALADDRQRFLEAGMDGYVAKPVEVHQLLAELQRVMPRHFSAARAALPTATEQAVKETPMNEQVLPQPDDPIDRDYLERNYLSLGCGDVLTDVIRIYLESYPHKVVSLKQGLADDAAEELVKVAHGLKGESGSVGARLVMATAAAMEKAARNGELDTLRTLMPQLEQQLAQAAAALTAEFLA